VVVNDEKRFNNNRVTFAYERLFTEGVFVWLALLNCLVKFLFKKK
jgi:hypothetical protein